MPAPPASSDRLEKTTPGPEQALHIDGAGYSSPRKVTTCLILLTTCILTSFVCAAVVAENPVRGLQFAAPVRTLYQAPRNGLAIFTDAVRNGAIENGSTLFDSDETGLAVLFGVGIGVLFVQALVVASVLLSAYRRQHQRDMAKSWDAKV